MPIYPGGSGGGLSSLPVLQLALASNYATVTTSPYPPIKWDAVVKDSLGGYNPATGIYTPARLGFYECSAAGIVSVGVSTQLTALLLLLNGNLVPNIIYQGFQRWFSAQSTMITLPRTIFRLSALTDSIFLAVVNTGGASNFGGDVTSNWASIVYLGTG